MKKITNKAIKAALNEGYSEEDSFRGYGIFSAGYMGGADHIEKLDVMDVFTDDKEAAQKAEKDGIPIIHDLPFGLDDEDSEVFCIDTPENRNLISQYLEKKYMIKWA